ncbi:MAG: hypothetical protein AB7D35_07480 [Bacteroidales bacterium]|jgi:hypothetical protein
MQTLMSGIFILITTCVFAQSRFPENQISINGFRNPSIGLEYHRKHLSVHGGYYITAFESGVTTKFFKIGLSYWFLPFGKKENPSALYASSSYLYGLNLDYKNQNALAFEAGSGFMLWKGLQLRFGVIGVAAKGKQLKVNPTPSINYSFKF